MGIREGRVRGRRVEGREKGRRVEGWGQQGRGGRQGKLIVGIGNDRSRKKRSVGVITVSEHGYTSVVRFRSTATNFTSS